MTKIMKLCSKTEGEQLFYQRQLLISITSRGLTPLKRRLSLYRWEYKAHKIITIWTTLGKCMASALKGLNRPIKWNGARGMLSTFLRSTGTNPFQKTAVSWTQPLVFQTCPIMTIRTQLFTRSTVLDRSLFLNWFQKCVSLPHYSTKSRLRWRTTG